MKRTLCCLFSESTTTRLNKIVASQFKCSRREANDFIEKGWVTVNGSVLTTPGSRFDPSSVHNNIQLDPECHKQRRQERTILLHKPLGFVSCQPQQPHHVPAIKLLSPHRCANPKITEDPRKYRTKIAVAGRLDANSSGLLIFTQSGHVASHILGNVRHEDGTPSQALLEKEYLVRVGGGIQLQPPSPSSSSSLQPAAVDHDDETAKRQEKILPYNPDAVAETLRTLRQGITDQGQFLEAVSVTVQNANQLNIVLTRGRNHHIRRMLAAVRWPVQAIKRVRIGKWTLGNLQPGQWRFEHSNERVSLQRTHTDKQDEQ